MTGSVERPTNLQIGALNWAVSWDDDELQTADDDRQIQRFGMTDPRRQRITVATRNRCETSIQETLVHEILHAINVVSGFKQSRDKSPHEREEENILALSPWLFGVLQDNPELVRYLIWRD